MKVGERAEPRVEPVNRIPFHGCSLCFETENTSGWMKSTSDRRAHTLSLAATVKTLDLKKGVNNVF